MSTPQKETVRVLASVITAVCSLVLLPIAGWCLLTVAKHDRQLAAIDSWRQEGSRYTGEDAARDFGVVTKLLEEQGKRIDDHAGRIRELEKRP